MSPRTGPSLDYDPFEIDPATTLRERIRLEAVRLQYPPSWAVGQLPDGSWRAELGVGLVTEHFTARDEVDVLQALLDAMRRARGSR
jgi:hypothetical protein